MIFRMDYDAQSSRYSMPPAGSGGDPFAPESSESGFDRLAYQDSRETGNLGETSNFAYGKNFSSSDEDSDDSSPDATDSRIEALQQEQKDLLAQVDSVTDSTNSF